MKPPTFIEATRPKEIQALLKFGRDSAWPLRITAASLIDEETSLSVTYEVGWKDCDSSIAWVWNRFKKAAISDGPTQQPAFQRDGVSWDISVRKENNSIRILLREAEKDEFRPSTPEDPGLPGMIMYAPNAVIKFRSIAEEVVQKIVNCVGALYQGRMRIVECLEIKEWAMVGALENDELALPAWQA
jgi:hypothetical protein